MSDPFRAIRSALVGPRLFFGNLTFDVHDSHDWGSLFCRDCGAFPHEAKAKRRCPLRVMPPSIVALVSMLREAQP